MSIMGAPRVSVIIPAYNAEAFIGECLDSVLRQTYQDFEIIVVNDGSSDATESALRPYRDRIVYVAQENRGVSAARNTAIGLAHSEFVAFLDADDYWLPDFLERQVPLLEKQAAAALVCSDVYLLAAGEVVQPLGVIGAHRGPLSKYVGYWRIYLSAVVARWQAIMDAGGFDETLRYMEDLDLWIRLAGAGYEFVHNPLPLAVYRAHSSNATGDLGKKLDGHIGLCEKLLRAHPLSSKDRQELIAHLRHRRTGYRTAAVDKLLAGDFAAARRYFAKAARWTPQDPRNAVGLALVAIAPHIARAVARRLRAASPPPGSV
jgi:glycosyltransferase involved in cell wall biosynthesis